MCICFLTMYVLESFVVYYWTVNSLNHWSDSLVNFIYVSAHKHIPTGYSKIMYTRVQTHMMTSSNGNIFRVTGHLCGDFTGEFPTQRPMTRSFDVSFDLRLNKRLSKQSRGWWIETPSWSLWRHGNVYMSLNNTDGYRTDMRYCSFNELDLVFYVKTLWFSVRYQLIKFENRK